MKKNLVITGLLLLAGAIAVGAVLALPKLTSSTAAAQGVKSERVLVIAVEQVKNGERFGGEVRIRYTDPAELPQRAEDASGLYLAREGQTLSLGTGAIEVEIAVEATNDEEPNTVIEASYDGAKTRLMVDENTIYYKDATGQPEITPEIIEAGELLLTRELEKGSLAGIGENMMIRAWGEQLDGSLVAKLVVYDPIQ
jgi:hypothetical protein